jgi:Fe-S-cluster-containing dehydrogenase component
MNASRYGMVIDTRTCVGCAACVIGCKAENDVAEGYTRDWIRTLLTGEYPSLRMSIHSERCNHCDNPPCVQVCPTGASHRGPAGTVQVNPAKCSGCKACVAACPYDARFIDPRSGAAEKCTFCMHRLVKGLPTTSCQEICPTRSIHFGDLDDPSSQVSRLLAIREWYVLKPEAGTRPKHFFLK